MTSVEPVLLLAGGVAAASLVSRRWNVPSPILLVLGGLAVAVLPGEATIDLNSEAVLALVIPPLLYAATIESSLTDLREERRGILSLAVALVALTSIAVGLVAYFLIPGLPLAAAIALGAIVGPTDAVAAIAIGRRLGMPRALAVLVEGEGLLNDAAGLTIYRLAVAAAATGFVSVWDGLAEFLMAGVGGVAVGLLAATALRWVRGRIEDPLADTTLSLATPFAVYLAAERFHASGVVAVVVTGLLLAHSSSRMLSGTSRLQSRAVWRLVTFLVEGAVFALIGLQLPSVLEGLEPYSRLQLVGWSAAILATVVLVRPLWIFGTAIGVPRLLGRPDATTPQVAAAASWAGMRGVISLAMVDALPLTLEDGTPFPHRNLLIFLTFVVICVTLLGQGLTYGVVLRRLGLCADERALLLEQANAQQRASLAGLAKLEELAGPDTDPVMVEQLRELNEHRSNAAWERLSEVRTATETPAAAFRRLRLEMLEAERVVLVQLRDDGRLSDASLRELQRRLDFEEAQLHR